MLRATGHARMVNITVTDAARDRPCGARLSGYLSRCYPTRVRLEAYVNLSFCSNGRRISSVNWLYFPVFENRTA